MDQGKSEHLAGEELRDVRSLLLSDGTLNNTEMARRGWVCDQIDDKAIFGEDASRLANAFQQERAQYFFVARTVDLLAPADQVEIFRFASTEKGVEAFQGPDWFEINLDDCLLFCLPFSCAVLRPGSVDATKFVGTKSFVVSATG